ncbi:MAG: putative transposase [Azoarcus sp.]|nr:putative transposase [Azoarcus sp.]
MRFAFIEAEKARYPVRLLCRCLRVSRAGYYASQGRAPSLRASEDVRLGVEVAAVHAESGKRYGSPRVHEELRERGRRVGRKRVARLMQARGLRARSGRRRKPCTTNSRHGHPVAANLLARNFSVDEPNVVWVGDTTYLPTGEGFAYLAVLLDLFSRKVVGYALSERNDTGLVLGALRRALRTRQPTEPMLHHTDRGSPLGFKEPSQHLNDEDSRWRNEPSEHRITHNVRACSRPAGRRPGDASIDSGSGVESPRGCRANKQERWPACLPLSGHDGFARVAGWHPRSGLCRDAISRSPKGKRSLSCVPADAECARSPATSADLRPRSLASFVGMPRRGAERWATGPQRRSGTRIGVHVARRSRSWRRMTI